MDDSVIKVLRRNGSWNKGKNKAVANEQMKEALKNRNEEFSLDENFGILAEEIKKRMRKKSASTEITENEKENINITKDNKINDSVKRNLLPLLKQVEILVTERDSYLSKIKYIDDKLDNVKREIHDIKKNYQNNLIEIQNNIDFFDETINVIENIKGEM